MLSLLAVRFEPDEAPAGYVTLTFSGGASIRLEVECIEARAQGSRSRLARALASRASGRRARRTPDRACRHGRVAQDRRARFRGPLRRAARGRSASRPPMSTRPSRAIIADVRAAGRRGADRSDREFDGLDLRQVGLRVSAAEIDAAARQGRRKQRSMRSSSRMTASSPITSGSCRRTTSTKTVSASSSARAGRRSLPPGSTCRAARRAIRARC